MYFDVEKYAFINAKIKGMKSRLFDDNKYRQLLETTQLDALIKALSETGYAPDLADIDTKEVDITEITRALDKSLIATYNKILKYFTPEKENDFIYSIISKYEVENIKIILRGKFKGVSAPIISDAINPTTGKSEVDYEALINSRDVAEFVSLLDGSIYGKYLKRALPLFEKDRRTAILENPLDMTYYIRIWENMGCLSGTDRRVMKIFLGTFFDITNIMVALRYRLYYDVPIEIVKDTIFPVNFRITKNELNMLAETNKDEYRGIFDNTYYGKIVGKYKDLPDLEMGLYRIMMNTTKHILSGSPFHIGTIVGFFALKEIEVANLKSIAEGKRHNLSEEEILENLIY